MSGVSKSQEGIDEINSILFLSNQSNTSSIVCKLSCGCEYWSCIHASCSSSETFNFLSVGSSIFKIFVGIAHDSL